VFESGILSVIFGSQKNKVTGGWRGLHRRWFSSLGQLEPQPYQQWGTG